MKKIILLLFCAGLFISGCKCQWQVKTQPEVSAVLGAGLSEVQGSESYEPKTGVVAGAEVKVLECGTYSSLLFGLLFTVQGANYTESYFTEVYTQFGLKSSLAEAEFSGKVNLTYINFPVLYHYQANSGFYGEIGIQPSFLLSAKDKPSGESSYDYKDYIKTFDLGIPIGAGYNINDQLSIGARAIFGLTNINTDESEMYSSDDTDRNFMLLGLVRYSFNSK